KGVNPMRTSPSSIPGNRDPLTFIDAYSRTAIRRSEIRRGPLPGWEPQDVTQQTHLELCLLLGSRYLEQIAAALSSGFRGTPEHAALKKATARAIGRARWRHDQRVRRDLPREVALPERYEGLGYVSDRGSIELAIDLEQASVRFSALEEQIWRQHRDGK